MEPASTVARPSTAPGVTHGIPHQRTVGRPMDLRRVTFAQDSSAASLPAMAANSSSAVSSSAASSPVPVSSAALSSPALSSLPLFPAEPPSLTPIAPAGPSVLPVQASPPSPSSPSGRSSPPSESGGPSQPGQASESVQPGPGTSHPAGGARSSWGTRYRKTVVVTDCASVVVAALLGQLVPLVDGSGGVGTAAWLILP